MREAIAQSGVSLFRIKMICGTANWIDSLKPLKDHPNVEVITVTESELERISLQKTPNQALAIISHEPAQATVFNFDKDLLLGLNQVQDPGNVGTIIRLADWFGFAGVIASPDSADFFSPKVVQSSMGSIFRVKLLTVEISEFIKAIKSKFPIYGTHLQGQNLYQTKLTKNGLILLGNESRGLSTELMKLTTVNLLIPDYSVGQSKPESLNVSIAASIICSEFRRRENG